MTIPFLSLKEINIEIENEITLALKNVIHSGQYILNDHTVKFETEFANYCDSSHCIGVSNGLQALELIITSLHLPKFSEIIVPANTCIATIMSISNSGHIPVLVEPDIKDYNIDITKIKEKITNKTKAIIAVHLYGKCCRMEELEKIAQENNLYLIEDAAQAHGSVFNNKKAGSFGIAAAFSFYPTKNLGAIGDGGAVTTNNESIAEEIRYLRNYGSVKKNFHAKIGTNNRLDELQAAFLSVKLKYIDKQNSIRKKIAAFYFENLKKSDCILPCQKNSENDNWHLYVIRHHRRNDLISYLSKNGISTSIHYPIPPHKQGAYKNYFKDQYPITELISNEIISIPCNPALKYNELDYISKIINKF